VGWKAVEAVAGPLVAEDAEFRAGCQQYLLEHGIDHRTFGGGKKRPSTWETAALPLRTGRIERWAPIWPMRQSAELLWRRVARWCCAAFMAAGATLAAQPQGGQRQVPCRQRSTSKLVGLSDQPSRESWHESGPTAFVHDVVGHQQAAGRRSALTQVGATSPFSLGVGPEKMTPSAWARRLQGHEATVVGEVLA